MGIGRGFSSFPPSILQEIMKFEITFTWSKIMALLVLLYAYHMDLRSEEGHAALAYALPFVLIMLGLKQALDSRKKNEINK